MLGVARHSETAEELVVDSSAPGDWSVRPKEMFFGSTIVDGEEVRRFTRIRPVAES